jgi:hypothetical protein
MNELISNDGQLFIRLDREDVLHIDAGNSPGFPTYKGKLNWEPEFNYFLKPGTGSLVLKVPLTVSDDDMMSNYTNYIIL